MGKRHYLNTAITNFLMVSMAFPKQSTLIHSKNTKEKKIEFQTYSSNVSCYISY